MCGIPHIAHEYNEAEIENDDDDADEVEDMWYRVCRPARQMLGASHSIAELSVHTHVCVILRAALQKYRSGETLNWRLGKVCKLIKSRHNWAILCLFLPNRAPASEKANKWYRQ